MSACFLIVQIIVNSIESAFMDVKVFHTKVQFIVNFYEERSLHLQNLNPNKNFFYSQY